MINDISELVGFIGAVYFTITVDNLLFKRFWTSDLYKLISLSLSQFDFALSTPLKESLLSTVKDSSKDVELRARYRGAYFLSLCIYLLIFCSVEASLKNSEVHFFSLLCTLIASLAICIRGLFGWKRLRNLAFSILSVPMVYFLCYCLISKYVNPIKLIEWYNVNQISLYTQLCIIAFIIFPIIIRLVLNWLNSHIYADYLIKSLNMEYEKYSSIVEGIKTEDYSKCAQEYDGVFKKIYMSASLSEDEVMTEFKEMLITRLKQIVKPKSWWSLIQYIFSDEHKTPRPNPAKPMGRYDLPESNGKTLETHCKEYHRLKNVSIKDYCKQNHINESDFRDYRKKRLMRMH